MPEPQPPRVYEARVIYVQDAPDGHPETLIVEATDEGAGAWLRIRTGDEHGWTMDSPDEIIPLLRRVLEIVEPPSAADAAEYTGGSTIEGPDAVDQFGSAPVVVLDLRGAMGGDDVAADSLLIAAAPELLEACRAAEQFITNGIEFGYIRMPDANTTDAAHDTLPLIRAAIAKAIVAPEGGE